MTRASVLTAALVASIAGPAWAQGAMPYTVVGDAIPKPLADKPGDAARGRAIVANRSVGLCLLCHSGPIAEERFQGNLAPSLAGDGARLNPDTIMPPYYRTTGLQRVAKPFEGKTILTAEQIEDVVAYLATLKE